MKTKLLFLCTVAGLLTAPAFSNETPTVKELIDNLSRSLDNLNSYRIKAECQRKSIYTFNSPDAKESESIQDVRRDGQRTSTRCFEWGAVGTKKLTKENPYYISFLWDGREYWRHSRSSGKLGKVIIDRKPKPYQVCRIQNETAVSGIWGYGAATTERVDTILRDPSSKVMLLPDKQKVGQAECYALKARTSYGDYVVWIDPDHGWNIAKRTVRFEKGKHQKFYDRTFDIAGKWAECKIEITGYEKIDDIWVPCEADISIYRKFSMGDHYGKAESHIKLTDILLNPDHDAMGSFLPDDIPNSAKVYIPQIENKELIWQDGKVLDSDGKVVFEPSDHKSPPKKKTE